MTAIIHNPANKTIYVGNVNEDGIVSYDQPFVDLGLQRQLKAQYKAGSISLDKAVYSPWSQEAQAKLPEYLSILKASKTDKSMRYKKAGLGQAADFSAIDKVVVLQEVLNTQFRIFVLPDAVRKVATPDIVLKVDVATVFNAFSDINEGVSVDTNRQSYARTSYTLPKDVAYFGLTDEAQYRAAHPLFALHTENAARALRAAWNAKIATVMEGGTTVSGHTWDDFTSGLSNNNPLADIEPVQTTITSNGGKAFWAGCHPKVFAGLVSNTFIKGAYNANQVPIDSQAAALNIMEIEDKVSNLTLFRDIALTNTKMTVYDFDQYIVAADGPTVAFQFREYTRDADMYKIEHYNQTQRTVAGKGRVLTGVHA